MKVGTLFIIEDYDGPFQEFVELYNKWQEATAFLSTRNCSGPEWDKLIEYGTEHQIEVREVIGEFLRVDGNDGNWMAMEVLYACCPEMKEIKCEGYVPPKIFQNFLIKMWDKIFEKRG